MKTCDLNIEYGDLSIKLSWSTFFGKTIRQVLASTHPSGFAYCMAS